MGLGNNSGKFLAKPRQIRGTAGDNFSGDDFRLVVGVLLQDGCFQQIKMLAIGFGHTEPLLRVFKYASPVIRAGNRPLYLHTSNQSLSNQSIRQRISGLFRGSR